MSRKPCAINHPELPGFGEVMRAESMKITKERHPFAWSGRGGGRALVICLPDKPSGAVDTLASSPVRFPIASK